MDFAGGKTQSHATRRKIVARITRGMYAGHKVLLSAREKKRRKSGGGGTTAVVEIVGRNIGLGREVTLTSNNTALAKDDTISFFC